MSASRAHELRKKTLARLIELYALERDLPLVGYGSTTFRREAKERGAEPDECYRLGTLMKDGEFPSESSGVACCQSSTSRSWHGSRCARTSTKRSGN